MFLADTHMHSAASFDSTAPRREMARAAAAQGLNLICFTDHHDVIDGESRLCPTFDWPEARAEHQAALAEHLPGLEICYGLELGNAFGDYAAAENSLKEPGLDYVIGSVHNTGKALGYLDYYYQSYTPELAAAHLEDYFASMLDLVQWGRFDSLGHIPYPLRYMRNRDGCDVGLAPYWEQIETILRQIVASGIALEVNTKGFRQARGDYAALLERYRDLGGEMVTCGGDAHRTEEVGVAIRDGYDLIREMGFRYMTVFRQRKPNLIPL